ncbi:acyl-CoA dehydrogenase family protein [Nocardioides sp.]|uniref:acyl-CoA dehydrogenase family protein n=1 Tax=Nocardioides sp. TaxID=35761 RepID=UPI0026393B8C|nr:acyl-CoA dehydrogenase family protein [Nocardioides sp.]
MDFTFSTEADEAAALAAQIAGEKVTPERVRELGTTPTPHHDPDLWQTLGQAGLLGLAVPGEYGGAGLGLIEAARVVVELGRVVAPVPAATHVAATVVLAEGARQQRIAEVLRSAADGSTLLTVALAEDFDHAPSRPETTAAESGADWMLHGAKTGARAGMEADAFLVPAQTPTGTAVFLVHADDPGVTLDPERIIDGDTTARLHLAGVRVPSDRLIGDAEGGTATRLAELTTALTCAEQLGVCEGAIALTAQYAGEREQFGRPIGTFQAVSQRLADGYIDTLGARLTLWQALWRLAEGLPATVEVATAKLWAADAGHRIAHTCVHIHGGVGIDLDGTAHRYFTAAKRWEFAGGGTTEQARRIGAVLAGQS